MFAKIVENQEDYKKFYEQFFMNLKLGIHKDTTNRPKQCMTNRLDNKLIKS